MSNHAERRFPPDKLCELEKLSTEDLHRFISSEMDMPDDVAPDAELIDAIWEVIEKREAAAGVARKNDAGASLRAFHERRLEEEAHGRFEMPKASSADHIDQIKPIKHKSGIKPFFHAVAVIAVVFLIFCGTASAFGVNVFQLLARWGSETFRYSGTQAATEMEEDSFFAIRRAVAKETETPVIPNWAPAETTSVCDVKTLLRLDGIHISGYYEIPQGELIITVRIYNASSEDSNTVYQRNDAEEKMMTFNNIEHFFSSNSGTSFVTWTYENVEVLIQGNLQMEDLVHMVTSIYEGGA